MRIIVLDSETTGLSEKDQVVEIATVELVQDSEKWCQGERWSTLVKPTCLVTPSARGIHHILDEELAEAPTMVDLLGGGPLPFLDEDSVLVAHNLVFDVRMLLQSGVPELLLPRQQVCTYRSALHLYPDETSYKNSSLRYSLGLTVPQVDGPPHRALPDAVTTASLLIRMLENSSEHDLRDDVDAPDSARDRNGEVVLGLCRRCGRAEVDLQIPCLSADEAIERLIRLTTEPVVLKRVPFGRSRGLPWEQMDDGFLHWVLNPSRTFGPDVKYTAQHWLSKRRVVT